MKGFDEKTSHIGDMDLIWRLSKICKFKSISDDVIDGVRDAMSFTFTLYKEFFEANGMKIYNTCMDTKETVFDRMEFEESLRVQ